jgi:hypothetical protein
MRLIQIWLMICRLKVLRWNLRIPTEGGHRFRTKAAIESDGKRPPIPGESGHRFRSKAATLWIG